MTQSVADIEFIQFVDFDLIDTFTADGTKHLPKFHDSLDILSKSEEFNAIETAGSHRNQPDAELQSTHIVVQVQHMNILRRQLGLGKQLKQRYDDAR